MKDFLRTVGEFLPKERVFTDELRRLAWGTDAGEYRLVPEVVILAQNEEEVSRVMETASRLGIPVTFRAAGTALSGQSISDSVLLVAGKDWDFRR